MYKGGDKGKFKPPHYIPWLSQSEFLGQCTKRAPKDHKTYRKQSVPKAVPHFDQAGDNSLLEALLVRELVLQLV